MKKISTIAIDKQISYVLTLQMIFLFFIGGAIFSQITKVNDIDVNGWVAALTYVGTIVFHELLHGVGFMVAGAKPKFGVGIAGIMPIAYATSSKKLTIPSMLIVAYLPFIALSSFFISLALLRPEYQQIALIGFLGNFTGAVGDLWIASKLYKYLKFPDVLLKDTKSGIEVYSSNQQAQELAKHSLSSDTRRLKFGKQWAITSLWLFGLQILLPVILPLIGFNKSIKFGFGEFYLFEIVNASDGTPSGATFNLAAPIIIGLTFTLLFNMFEKLRFRKS